MKENEVDYAKVLVWYSIILNVVLLVAFGFVFWHTFVRGEWNAGYVAARNNPENVGKLDIAGVGDTTPTIHKGRGR